MTSDDLSAHTADLRALYPEIPARASGRLRVGAGHEIFYEECGRPDGAPIVVLHGGPGGGCSPAMRRFFDPSVWRIILFDQRGCGRSTPHASLRANTTWELVDDMERLRVRLGVDRWALFGGSWGSTLAVAYAQTYRDRVLGLVLRGVFLLTPEELAWFYGGHAGAILPEAWSRFLGHLDPHERDDPISAYHRRLVGRVRAERSAAARAWTAWESAAIDARRPMLAGRTPLDPRAADALARLECHYFLNGGFLKRPRQLLDEAPRLKGLPGAIVQGRMDLVTPPRAAIRLASAWPDASVRIVDAAGHAASDPGIIDGLVRATDALGARLA